MKRLSIWSSISTAVGTALFLFASSCGTAATEPETDTRAAAVTQAAADTAQKGAQAAEQEGVGPETGATGATDPAGLGKRCWADCTVQADPGAMCPSNVGGYGNTTFLGGCNKACNKAQGDAAAKLSPGCHIFRCSLTGC